MAKRTIVKIDEELCNGCGQCITPCVEGAITLVNGKAKVLREEICDGGGVCLSACPTGALSLEEREAPAFDPEAAKAEAAGQAAGAERVALARPSGSAAPAGAAPASPAVPAPGWGAGEEARCLFCQADDSTLYLFPVRFRGRERWACARCLPRLIHG